MVELQRLRREVDKLQIEVALAGFGDGDNMAHVVVEDLGGYAAQVAEGADVTVHKCFERAAVDKPAIHRPGEAQHQHEQINEKAPAICVNHFEVGPVHLGLAARFGLKADVGGLSFLLFDIPYEVSHRVVSAAVAELL